jgi:xanthine dehydrogenase molybdenum-binding subunit
MHSPEPIAALLARRTGRPVKIVYTREEEFLAARFRHPIWMKARLGAQRGGTLTALEVDMLTDSGAYISQACGVARVAAVNGAILYRIPNVRVHSEIVYTNKPYGGAYRGYGKPQAAFMIESLMDQLAESLGMDPIELRIKNGNQPNTMTYMGQRITSCAYEETLRRGREASAWDSIRGRRLRRGPKVRGIGVGTCISVGGGARVQGDSDASGAIVIMRDDGAVTLTAGGQEIGTGGSTVFAQIVAEELGVTMDRVFVHNSDTDVMPWDIGCHAQRNVFCAGNAVLIAAREARGGLLDEIERQLGLDPGQQVCSLFVRSAVRRGRGRPRDRQRRRRAGRGSLRRRESPQPPGDRGPNRGGNRPGPWSSAHGRARV